MAYRLSGHLVGNRLIYRKFSSETKKKVYCTRNDIPSVGIEILKSKVDLHMWDSLSNGDISRKELLEAVKGKDGLFVTINDKVDKELLDAAGTQLKVISSMSVGMDHIDVTEVKSRKIRLSNTPFVSTESVAELAVALLLATSRNLFIANRQITLGKWGSWSPLWMCGPGLEHATVGIVGFGRIGQSIARKVRAFQVDRVLFCNLLKYEDKKFGADQVEIEELMRISDFVVSCISLAPETKRLFNAKLFSYMKPSGIFVNVSRGGVVDQDALIFALEQGVIRGAGLDVMTPEPLPPDHKLTKLENCVLLPHIGNATYQARSAMAVLTAQNIISALEGRIMPTEFPIMSKIY